MIEFLAACVFGSILFALIVVFIAGPIFLLVHLWQNVLEQRDRRLSLKKTRGL